ncbi:MAG: glycoside-pentoside-hexuronide (GPH):cation symporter [Treponema sp.]|jgi:GPH family glycoside/pentoside/hexuronide:cation symporter|nr:glycoside-pentoside-hexuronide (GPH):cation symporter [Treponema sp.]
MSDTQNNQERIRLPEQLLYASGNVPMGWLYSIIAMFLVYFYTDVIGVNAGAVGVIILISKIFDGITDLIAGTIVDRTHTKWGSARPWIMRMAVPVGLSYVALVTVPNFGDVGKLIYIFVTYNVVNAVVYTLMGTASMALPTFMTHDQHQRSVLYVWGMLFAGACQMALAMFMLPFINYMGGGQLGWIKVSAILGTVAVIWLLLIFRFTKERFVPPHVEGKEVSVFKGLLALIKNKYWFMALGIQFSIVLHQVVTLTIGVYYAKYILEDANLVGQLIMWHHLPGLLLTFAIPALMKRFTKRNLGLFGAVLQLFGQVIVMFNATSSFMAVSMVIRGLGFSMIMCTVNGMIADTIEYGEWKTGVRTQALVFSANMVGQKVGNGLGNALLGLYLAFLGYVGTAAVQTPQAIQGIRNAFIIAPIAIYAVLIIIYLLYKLDKDYPAIMKDLAKRRETISQPQTGEDA